MILIILEEDNETTYNNVNKEQEDNETTYNNVNNKNKRLRRKYLKEI